MDTQETEIRSKKEKNIYRKVNQLIEKYIIRSNTSVMKINVLQTLRCNDLGVYIVDEST